MRLLAVMSLLLALLVPSGVAAQEPTRVCTRLTVPEGHLLADSPALWGEPPDGEACDVIVYLPIVLADGLMIGTLSQAAEQSAADEARAEGLVSMTCLQLANLRSRGDELAGAVYEERCPVASPVP